MLHVPFVVHCFFRTLTGREPTRAWLRTLSKSARRIIGEDLKTAQFGWPFGMPLIRKLEPGLWEVRSRLEGGTARVIFTVEDHTMILLHGFIKQTRKTAVLDLEMARRRLAALRGEAG